MKRLAAIGAAIVLVVAAVVHWRTREPSVNCETFRLDSARWTRERKLVVLDSETDAEHFTRQSARNLVRCRLLTGRTRRQIRDLLGKPDYRARDLQPRAHTEYSYLVGYTPSRGSEEEDELFMEFDRGRVAYVAAPAQDRDGYQRELKEGTPVGGGP